LAKATIGTWVERESWTQGVLDQEERHEENDADGCCSPIASSAAGYAQQKDGNAGGASEVTPGDQMKDASEVTPGDQMKDKGGPAPGSRGASEFSPGDRKKDAGSTVGRRASTIR
jgi:hypothetical protein